MENRKEKTAIVPAENEMSMEDLIANVSCIITVSQDDYIKRMPVEQFREQKRVGRVLLGFN